MIDLKNREYKVLDVKVHALQTNDAIDVIQNWLEKDRSFHYISSTNINNVAEAQESAEYFEVMRHADLSVPDGIPLLWYGRTLGHELPERCGIEEIMEASFELSNKGHNYSHFFYGNSPEVLKNLRKSLLEKYPDLNIAGMYSPPFRALTPEEEDQHIAMINSTHPDFLWVSLGCPKQELWLYRNRHKLNAVIGGGAGAVFNFMSGDTVKAPAWIQYMGMEWLMRLSLNPKRLYKRYLVKYPKCVYNWMTNKSAPHAVARPVHTEQPVYAQEY
jgi:N-acetylglucosaminyldiphosphoundecaprenol N-acetyl-beta-D-mannosaminyltransferase